MTNPVPDPEGPRVPPHVNAACWVYLIPFVVCNSLIFKGPWQLDAGLCCLALGVAGAASLCIFARRASLGARVCGFAMGAAGPWLVAVLGGLGVYAVVADWLDDLDRRLFVLFRIMVALISVATAAFVGFVGAALCSIPLGIDDPLSSAELGARNAEPEAKNTNQNSG